jgi:hypothetical protein
MEISTVQQFSGTSRACSALLSFGGGLFSELQRGRVESFSPTGCARHERYPGWRNEFMNPEEG